MPEPVLTVLKYLFLALLYLFFLRVLRAVWVEMREPRVVAERPRDILVEQFDTAGPPETSTAQDTVISQARNSSSFTGPTLTVLAPPERSGARFPVSGEVTIGRSPGCAISLPEDTFICTVHARVFTRDGECWVEDLGSTNGTLLNDATVSSPVRMHPDDQLQVGQTVLRLSR